MSGRLALGIDLGTTFSKAAFLDDNASTQMVRKIPSVVYVSGNEVCVGTVAWNRGNSENTSGQLIRLTKRHLARPDMALPQTSGRYTAVELTSLILGELKSATERLLNRKIHEAVLSVPVSFGDVERRAVEDAARLCNLNVLDLIEEPVAVALKFWTEDEGASGAGANYEVLAKKTLFLVFDLGGGTLDLALVAYARNEVKVLATLGNEDLGGEQWTRILDEMLAEQIRNSPLARRHDLAKSSERRLALAEGAKLKLSDKSVFFYRIPGTSVNITLKKSDFEKRAAALVGKARQECIKLLKEGMKYGQVNQVLIAGGASRMPMIQEMIKSIPGLQSGGIFAANPEEWVARGAALKAGIILSRNEPTAVPPAIAKRLAGITELRVSPHSLGVIARSPDGATYVNEVLIPRNTRLPAHVTKNFVTVRANQRNVRIQIVEGESLSVEQLKPLGTCRIPDLPEGLPAESPIAVTLSYDTTARLSVTAKDLVSGKEVAATLSRDADGAAVTRRTESGAPATLGAVGAPDAAVDRLRNERAARLAAETEITSTRIALELASHRTDLLNADLSGLKRQLELAQLELEQGRSQLNQERQNRAELERQIADGAQRLQNKELQCRTAELKERQLTAALQERDERIRQFGQDIALLRRDANEWSQEKRRFQDELDQLRRRLSDLTETLKCKTAELVAEKNRFRVDPDLVRAKQEETRETQTVLHGFGRQADDVAGIQQRPVPDVRNLEKASLASARNGEHSACDAELERRFIPLLRSVVARVQWGRVELSGLARRQGLMLDGAIEAINLWTNSRFCDLLIDNVGDDFTVNASLAEAVRTQLRDCGPDTTDGSPPG